MPLARATKLLVEHAKASPKPKSGYRFEQPSQDDREVRFALSYLDAFGYLGEELSQWKDISLGDIVEGIKKFQNFFGLARNGSLCSKTIKAMEAPRCGCPDILHADRESQKQYLAVKAWAKANLPAWRKRNLLVAVQQYVPGIGKAEQQEILLNAFRAWTRYGNLDVEFARQGQTPDIVVSTGEGPRSNFDGPGGTLAWAYLPNGTDQQLLMKFDLGETWVVSGGNQRGIVFFNVACHEIGHLLGLDHSRVQSALMAPYYNPQVAVPQQNDDVPRFQARYGVRPDDGGGEPPPPPPAGKRKLIVEFPSSGSYVELDGKKIA